MSKLNHTPGPWHVIKKQSRVGYADYEVAWSEDGELVCDIVYHEGDANLIAAAPDLLALLIESQNNIGGDWRERRDAIIRKAMGA
jgi:hypothetical protein